LHPDWRQVIETALAIQLLGVFQGWRPSGLDGDGVGAEREHAGDGLLPANRGGLIFA
jgi:hypothetical protein